MKSEKVSRACDVFSFGMVVFEIFSREVPFSQVPNHMLIPKIIEGEVSIFNVPFNELCLEIKIHEPCMELCMKTL